MARKSDSADHAPAVNDAYTGMLGISLIALLVGCVLLFLDYSAHSGTPPKIVAIQPRSGGGAMTPTPQTPPPGNQAQPNPMNPMGNPMPPMGNPMAPMGNPMPPMANQPVVP